MNTDHIVSCRPLGPSVRRAALLAGAVCGLFALASCSSSGADATALDVESDPEPLETSPQAIVLGSLTLPASAETFEQIGVRYWQVEPDSNGALVRGLRDSAQPSIVQLQIMSSSDHQQVHVLSVDPRDGATTLLSTDGSFSGSDVPAALRALQLVSADLKLTPAGTESGLQIGQSRSALFGLDCPDQCLLDYGVCLVEAGVSGSYLGTIGCYITFVVCEVNCPQAAGGGPPPPPPSCRGTCCETNGTGSCTQCIPKGASCP